jgi:pentatricopeptide repeat domain-containing protein 2
MNVLNAKHCGRSLYSPSSLGIDGYIEAREKAKQHFLNDGEKFRAKMNEFIEDDKTSMIFTEDLKNMVHLVQPNENDLNLLEKMLQKFNQQNKEIRFGNFIFGPVVMRLLFHIKNTDLALKLFKDPEMNGFFDQSSSYQILVDMLYEEGRYQDVFDVFQTIRSRQIQGEMYPRHVVLLVFAACYKENTPESFTFSSELWTALNDIGHIPMRRTVTFAAALALKQNAPHVALEIVVTMRPQTYMTVRNIKVLALTELGRADDALPILRAVLEVNDPAMTKHTFAKDVVARLKEVVNQSGNSELLQNYNRLEKFLFENGHVHDSTLDDLLTSQINATPHKYAAKLRKDRSVLAGRYNNDRFDRSQQRQHVPARSSYRRPGLHDLN